MTSITAPWPFFQWGMDVLGPLPEAPGKVKFVIVAIDYFTKWIEAKLLAKTTGKEQINTAVAHPQANGLVERANRSLMEGIKTRALNEEEIRLNLDLLRESREAAAIREARYKMKMEHYYNKSVRHVSFKVGEYVYQRNEASRVENLGKLGPKWEGSYLVTEAYQNGSYKLETMAGREVP
ncbi:reverse transcriptase domain-containing protein [Tanacetum coccineum]